jgi:VWFA-related protein
MPTKIFPLSFLTFSRLFAVMAVLLFAAPVVFAQDEKDDDVIKVETNLVVLNAVVTDSGGKYVSNLKETDFKVFEDGKPQEISTFSAESTPFAAVVLLDTSGSMETRLALGRAAAIRFLDGLRGEDVAAVYNFDSKVQLVQEFSPSRDLSPVAYDLKAKGMTVLNDAVVQAAKDLAERPEKRRAIIVLSDGANTAGNATQEKALKAALAVNATIYTVDMSALDFAPQGGTITSGSSNARMERMKSVNALKSFAEKSGGRFVPVAGGQELRDAFKQIVEELGVQYTIGYQPTNTNQDGKWRAIEVKISKPSLQVRARKGYNAPKAAKR